MKKSKEMIRNKVFAAGGLATVATAAFPVVTAYASGGDVTATSALTSACTTIAADISGAISAVLPIALPLVGAVLVVTIGLKVFKRIASKA